MTTSPTPLPACPRWCTLPPDHTEDDAQPGQVQWRIHRAPAFGLVTVDMDDLSGFGFAVGGKQVAELSDGEARTVSESLRQLVADATRAARWLEGQR